MKYKLKIVPQDGGYVGYALQNDEVIYTTSVHKDTIMASRELSKFVSNQDKPQTISPVPFQRANSALPIPSDQKPLLLNHIKKNLPDLRRIINDIQKFSVSGVLNIRFDDCSEFAEGLFKKIQKQDLLQVRKEVIENEKVFSNDYGLLLKQLFEVIFQSSTDYEKKLNMLMIVSKSLENHSLAIDKEINFFSALISLSKAF